MTDRVELYGEGAYLIHCDGAETLGLLRAIDQQVAGVEEAHGGEASILVQFDPRNPEGANLRQQLRGLQPLPIEAAAHPVTLPAYYDGEDLGVVAKASDLSVAEVIELHSSATYRVAFCGFMPGFAYLTGLPAQLQLPRRPTPRTRVPAGSIAIAAHYCAVYPVESPGGWHLLGRTLEALFDVEASPPALLAPGTQVRFEVQP